MLSNALIIHYSADILRLPPGMYQTVNGLKPNYVLISTSGLKNAEKVGTNDGVK